jgi:hypothetical protein
MKVLRITAFFPGICLSLSLSLHAQEAVKDSVVPQRMSFEKADSLLISLSKKKSKKTASADPEISGQADTLFGRKPDTANREGVPFAADTLTGTVTAPELPLAAGTVNAAGTATATSLKINRQKANIPGSGLVIERKEGAIRLKNGGEENDDMDLRSVNEGTVFGIGGYKMKDDYLSPEKYGGAGFRFINERMRLTRLAEHRISRQNIVNVDISSAINGAENANFLSVFVNYSLGYHYRFLPDPYVKILVGGSAHSMFGMVYNTRNGNNPMTLHADLDLNGSLIVIHEFRIKKHLLAIRYQFETPFAGVLFCPVYGQSYYEIFTLGNTAEVLNFSSFRNKFAVRNYLTLDFPVGGTTFRAGYFGSLYTTDVHGIDRSIVSHNIMVGVVGEFVPFGGRDMRKRNLFRSAYY